MANLDLSATLQLVDKVSAPLNHMIATAERLNRAFDKTSAQVEQFGHAMQKINAQSLSTMNPRLQQTQSIIGRMREMVRGLAGDFKLVYGAINAVHNKAQGLSNKFADYRKGLRQDAVSSVAKMGGAAFVGYQAIKPAIAFDKQMSGVQAVLELEKNSAELQKLRNQAITEGARSAFSATQSAAAQYELAAAGFTSQQVFDALSGTLDLAAAGNLEVARAAEIAGATLNGFALQAGEVGRVGDIMTMTANKTAVGIEDMGESMKIAAPAAKIWGASVEQAHAMVGILGNIGIKGTDAGTGIKAVFSRLATLPKPAAKALQKLKINPVDKDGTMKNIGELLNEIRVKIAPLAENEKMEMLKGIGGLEHMTKLEALVASTGVWDETTGKVVNKFDELVGYLEDADGAARKVADVQMDNLAGDLDQLGGAFESLVIALGGEGGVLNGTLREFAQNLTGTIEKITDWVQKNPELVKTIGSLILKFIKLNVALFAIKYSVALVFGAFFGMLAHFVKFGAVMMLTNAILAKFGITFFGKFKLMGQALLFLAKNFGRAFLFLARQSIPMVITALANLSVALFTTPIGWIVLAIAGAALLIYKYWQPLKAFFTGFWQGFVAGFSPAIEGFKMAWQGLVEAFAPLAPIVALIKEGLSELITWLQNLFTPVQSTKAELDGLSAKGQSLGFTLGQLAASVARVAIILINVLGGAFRIVGTAIGTFAAMVVVHGGQVLSYLGSLPSRIIAFFLGLPARMGALGTQIMQGLKNGIMRSAEAVIKSISSIGARIKSAFTSVMSIHSPSRVFAGYGDNIMQGLNNGLIANQSPISAVTALANDMQNAFDPNLGGVVVGTSKPITGVGQPADAGQHSQHITINVYGAQGQSEETIARLVASKLGEINRTKNNALYDYAEDWS